MVPLRWIALHFLLVRKVLLVAKQQQRAHGGLVVTAFENGGGDDATTGSQRDFVSPDPAGTAHGFVELGLAAHDGKVDRVPQQPIAGAGAANEIVGDVNGGQDAVQSRQHQVGQNQPEQDEEWCQIPAPGEPLREHQPGQPQCGKATEGEHKIVHHGVDGPPPRTPAASPWTHQPRGDLLWSGTHVAIIVRPRFRGRSSGALPESRRAAQTPARRSARRQSSSRYTRSILPFSGMGQSRSGTRTNPSDR